MLWLKESDSNDIANNVESKLEESFGQVPSAGLPATGVSTSTKKTPSPPDLKREAWEQWDGEEYQAGFQAAASPGERRLMGTQEYDSTHLVRLMYTAILCSAAANPYAGTKHEKSSSRTGKIVQT